MNEIYAQFIESLDSSGTARMAKWMSKIGDCDYANCTIDDLEQIILQMNPKSKKAIIDICNMMRNYAKFIKNDKLYYVIIPSLNRDILWEKAKPNASPKFISHMQFNKTYCDIGSVMECNAFYYQTLLWSLYEGIYNRDMSVIKNLRSSDVNGVIVTLREDNGNSYQLKIPLKLSEDLKELSEVNMWERKYRYGVCELKIQGEYPDSCFKIENRGSISENKYRKIYYARLEKITNDLLGYNISPLQIYVSGIMYRIRISLENNGITLEEAFADENRNKLVNKIIANELTRCNYNIPVYNFREMVKSHLDVFTK